MGRTRDDRVLIMPGIYRGRDWLYGIVHVRGAGDIDPKTKRRKSVFREKRFALSVPLTDITAWQATTRAQLIEHTERGTTPGSLKRDALTYLRDYIGHLAHPNTRKVEINHWIAALGDRARSAIRPVDISRVRAEWRAAGASAKTVNNRCDALRALYHALDGSRAWTPLDDLPRLHVHRTPIRVVDDATILAVDQKLQQMERLKKRKGGIYGPATRARFRVLVSTGRRPSELMRAEPGDVDLARRVWIVRDGKGGFSPGVYLNDDMLAAWQFFADVDAWGPYDTDEHAKRIRKAGWPKDVPLYNARHTVGIALAEKGIDLSDIGPMLGHKRLETARKHYVPVRHSRIQAASTAIDGRFGGWAVQTGVQNTSDKSQKSGAKTRQQKRR